MPSTPSWMREARRLFEQAYGPAETLDITIRSNGNALRLTVRQEEPPKLSDIEQAILEAARKAGTVVSAKKLAALAGYAYAPHFRSAVAELTRAGMLSRLPDGLAVN